MNLKIQDEAELLTILEVTTPTEKRVLHSIFYFISKNKEAYPSFDTLAENASCCRRSVIRICEKYKGVLFDYSKRKRGRKSNSNLYYTNDIVLEGIKNLEALFGHLSNFDNWREKIFREHFFKGLSLKEITTIYKKVMNKKKEKCHHQNEKMSPNINSYIHPYANKDLPSSFLSEERPIFKINNEMYFGFLPKNTVSESKIRDLTRKYSPLAHEQAQLSYRQNYIYNDVKVKAPIRLYENILMQKQRASLGF